MSIRYEGAYAKDVQIEAFRPGKRIGEDVMTKESLVINYDEVFYLEGTKTELLEMLARATAAVQSLPDPEDYKPFTVVGNDDCDIIIDGVFEGHVTPSAIGNSPSGERNNMVSERRFVDHVQALSPDNAIEIVIDKRTDDD